MASDDPQPRGARSGSGRRELHIRGGTYPGGGRRHRRGRRAVIGAALVATAPLWLLIGYPLERTWGRLDNHGRLGFDVTRHPVAVALSAPMRFVSKRVRGGRGRRPGPGSGPELSGDRFPRRPKPAPSGDSVALGEPRG
ncbi:hypothetical protein [Streptacidiphilus neutrinimicus]|uniref:hypothetical protein n=1 Tax=Streptacidiphilus neutrinimicus TaxID=105420 RepID=UPI0005AABE15|nr:hypothetical protein [Streptacidiphilus neutrinimicus]